MMINVERVSAVLGGVRTLKHRVRTLNDLHEIVAAGLPKTSVRALFSRLSKRYAVEVQPLRDFVAPRATLKRRRTRLSPAESQRLERLARIVAMTEEVWQDRIAAAEFLTRPHGGLGGRTPLQMVTTDLGARQVEELLAAIEFGLPA
jgi:putative toxin-antitoxin system antitoxin component (TIGR02293 family)